MSAFRFRTSCDGGLKLSGRYGATHFEEAKSHGTMRRRGIRHYTFKDSRNVIQALRATSMRPVEKNAEPSS